MLISGGLMGSSSHQGPECSQSNLSPRRERETSAQQVDDPDQTNGSGAEILLG
jgi:hypothetical protein